MKETWSRSTGEKSKVRYDVDLRLAPMEGLPGPPDPELKQVLADKIAVLDAIAHEADEQFPGEEWDPEFEALMDDEL